MWINPRHNQFRIEIIISHLYWWSKRTCFIDLNLKWKNCRQQETMGLPLTIPINGWFISTWRVSKLASLCFTLTATIFRNTDTSILQLWYFFPRSSGTFWNDISTLITTLDYFTVLHESIVTSITRWSPLSRNWTVLIFQNPLSLTDRKLKFFF